MAAATFDAGAVIAFQRSDRRIVRLLERAAELNDPILIPSAVVAQTWRDGRRQARLARLLASPTIRVVPLDDLAARSAGQLCGIAGTTDITDASVAACAIKHKTAIVTGDPEDLRRLAPNVRIHTV